MTDRPEIARAPAGLVHPDRCSGPVGSIDSGRIPSDRMGTDRHIAPPAVRGARPLATHQRCGVRCGVARRRERETSRMESVIPDPRSIARARRTGSRFFVIVGLNSDRSDAGRNRLNGSCRSPRFRGESTGERSVGVRRGKKCPARPVRNGGEEIRKIPTMSQRKAVSRMIDRIGHPRTGRGSHCPHVRNRLALRQSTRRGFLLPVIISMGQSDGGRKDVCRNRRRLDVCSVDQKHRPGPIRSWRPTRDCELRPMRGTPPFLETNPCRSPSMNSFT